MPKFSLLYKSTLFIRKFNRYDGFPPKLHQFEIGFQKHSAISKVKGFSIRSNYFGRTLEIFCRHRPLLVVASSTFFVAACVEMENGGQNYWLQTITKVQEPPKFDRARRKLVVLNQATIICREWKMYEEAGETWHHQHHLCGGWRARWTSHHQNICRRYSIRKYCSIIRTWRTQLAA